MSHCSGSKPLASVTHQYWISSVTLLGYPVALVTPAIHRWGRYWCGPAHIPGSEPGLVSQPALQCPNTTTTSRASSPSHTHTTTASFPALYSQGAGLAIQSAAASEEQGQSIIQGDRKVANVRSTVCLIFQSTMPGILYLDEQVADCCVRLHEADRPTIISLELTVCSMMLRSRTRVPDLHTWLSSTCLFATAACGYVFRDLSFEAIHPAIFPDMSQLQNDPGHGWLWGGCSEV